MGIHEVSRKGFFYGCLAGAPAPLAAYLVSGFTSLHTVFGGKSLSFYVLAALINLLLVRFYYRRAHEGHAHGVILITFAAVIVLIFSNRLSHT